MPIWNTPIKSLSEAAQGETVDRAGHDKGSRIYSVKPVPKVQRNLQIPLKSGLLSRLQDSENQRLDPGSGRLGVRLLFDANLVG
jgi:hypothetical protein